MFNREVHRHPEMTRALGIEDPVIQFKLSTYLTTRACDNTTKLEQKKKNQTPPRTYNNHKINYTTQITTLKECQAR